MYEGIVQLKMLSSDGKYYKTDVATTFPTNPIYPITQSPQRNLIPNPIFHIVRRNESVFVHRLFACYFKLIIICFVQRAKQINENPFKKQMVHKFVDHKLVNHKNN